MKALIFGVSGQAGQYLSDLLFYEGYEVIGVSRRSSQSRDYLRGKDKTFKYEECDITDFSNVFNTINKHKPDLVFNCAAQSHVHTSFHSPHQTMLVTGNAVLNILESMRMIGLSSFLQFSSSEMFGSSFSYTENGVKYQNENTLFHPISPYAVAKLTAHNLVTLYREAYGMKCCSAINFNFESPLRGENFVTRKITKFIGSMKKGDKLKLGNIKSVRDWTFCGDTVRAALQIIKSGKDYVVGSGKCYSVEDFLEESFTYVNKNWRDYVVIDFECLRPLDVEYLCSDPSKIKSELGWEPKIDFKTLVHMMVKSDLEKKN